MFQHRTAEPKTLLLLLTPAIENEQIIKNIKTIRGYFRKNELCQCQFGFVGSFWIIILKLPLVPKKLQDLTIFFAWNCVSPVNPRATLVNMSVTSFVKPKVRTYDWKMNTLLLCLFQAEILKIHSLLCACPLCKPDPEDLVSFRQVAFPHATLVWKILSCTMLFFLNSTKSVSLNL